MLKQVTYQKVGFKSQGLTGEGEKSENLCLSKLEWRMAFLQNVLRI